MCVCVPLLTSKLPPSLLFQWTLFDVLPNPFTVPPRISNLPEIRLLLFIWAIIVSPYIHMVSFIVTICTHTPVDSFPWSIHPSVIAVKRPVVTETMPLNPSYHGYICLEKIKTTWLNPYIKFLDFFFWKKDFILFALFVHCQYYSPFIHRWFLGRVFLRSVVWRHLVVFLKYSISSRKCTHWFILS